MIAENLQRIRAEIAAAARRAKRNPEEITLVAVSKLFPVELIREAVDAGQTVFGENYIQEAAAKKPQLPEGVHLHFIGHLQSNKAKDVVGRFALIHTVDSEGVARKLDQRLASLPVQGAGGVAPMQDMLLQVNIGDEEQKSGVDPDDLPALAETVLALPRLRLLGLMCMPPIFDDGEASRPYFARLRELRDALSARVGLPLPHLSMGMSHDVEVAVAEGATIVRVGTDIFGPRPPKS